MKLGIGTAQFGMNYGVSNRDGKTPFNEVSKILKLAKENNINTLDTAHCYGNSEQILGKSEIKEFKIITKVQYPNKFKQSLKNLSENSIDGLLFHNADILINNSRLWNDFEQFKQNDLVKKIGVSVYTPEQLDRILEKHSIDIVQLPINLLDQRFKDYLKELKSRNIEIHIRSVFLQGLLLMDINEINSYFTPIKPVLKDYFKILKNKNLTKIEGALGFVKSINEVDCIILGINNHEQLITNINAFHKQVDIDYSNYKLDDENFINPAKWRDLD